MAATIVATAATAALLKSRARLTLLEECSDHAILWVSQTGRVLRANTTATKYFAMSKKHLRKSRINTLLRPRANEGKKRCVENRDNLSSNPSFSFHEGTYAVPKDGMPYRVRIKTRTLTGCLNSGLLLVLKDVSSIEQEKDEFKRINQQLRLTKQVLGNHNSRLESQVDTRTKELRLAKEAADAANSFKTEFLAKMSHEFRTPLHGILSYTRFGRKALRDTTFVHIDEYLENIESCSNSLLHQVNDLLDLAQLESGNCKLDRKRHDLHEVIAGVIRELECLLDEKSIHICRRFHGKKLLAQVDGPRLAQVVRNLIANAVRVSPAGGDIEIETWRNDDRLGVAIVDSGPGIPESELVAVFEKFKQSSGGDGQGTGLGLAICKEIISLHGGEVSLENCAGSGLRAQFEIPVDARSAMQRSLCITTS